MPKKNQKEIICKKPNQTVMISNHQITATQRKAYNVLLHKASQELKINNNQDAFVILLAEIKEMAGIKATDNWHLKDDLKDLMKIQVECIRENNEWAAFNLLSEVKMHENFLWFEFSSTIRKALIQNDYYTTLDLLTLKSLTGKYAIIMYELAMRYQKVEIPKLDIEEFRALTGMESYRDFKEIRKKCIEPAIKEINEKTDIDMDYKPVMVGRKVVALKFNVTQKPQIPQIILDIQVVKDDLYAIIPIEHRNKKTVQRLVDKWLKTHGADYVRRNTEYANQNVKKNYRAYLNQALELDWGLGLQEDQEQAQKFSVKLQEGMTVEFSDGRQFKIEAGCCIFPNGYEGGCMPQGEILTGIKEGRINIIQS